MKTMMAQRADHPPSPVGVGGQFLCVLGMVAVLMTGCSSVPTSAPTPTPSGIRDAIPKVEPRSKYGNPPFYDVSGHRYYTMTSAQGYVERGVASWYGPGFHGKRTSSGEPYDMYAMTAAHTTLPLPTYLYVTNLVNGRTAILRVNDRGPFEKNRLIDLSYAGAKRLGLDGPGTALVEVQALDPAAPSSWPSGAVTLVAAARRGESVATVNTHPIAPATPIATSSGSPNIGTSAPKPPTLYVQVGAFADRENAERLRQRLVGTIAIRCIISTVQTTQQVLYRLRLGPLDSVENADRLMEPLNQLGIRDPHIVVD